jgi:hypothetical protein
MKKEWQMPVLEVLDVNRTMGQADGSHTDNTFPTNTPKEDLTFS